MSIITIAQKREEMALKYYRLAMHRVQYWIRKGCDSNIDELKSAAMYALAKCICRIKLLRRCGARLTVSGRWWRGRNDLPIRSPLRSPLPGRQCPQCPQCPSYCRQEFHGGEEGVLPPAWNTAVRLLGLLALHDSANGKESER